MIDNVKNKKSSMPESRLMQQILKVRYTDLEEEKRLCKELLSVSEAEQYYYGSAFANVYLMDSQLSMGEYTSCDFYLLRAVFLCREYGYDDLMLVLCNNAGLYYQKLNDDQTALSYLLEGKKLAEKLGDITMLGKLYNNIGYSFGGRDDWESAGVYFRLAYRTVEDHLDEENKRSSISYLSNIAEACRNLGDLEGARKAMERCEELGADSAYSRVRLGVSWCSYYAMCEDWDKFTEMADRLINSDLLAVEDHFFICDMAESLCTEMLAACDEKRADRLLAIMDNLEYDNSLSLKYRIQCLKIRCWEQFGETDKLDQAYRDYYEIVKDVSAVEDDMRIQSMLSKIQINQAMHEHEEMVRNKRALENASQLDELTGLYNRRYFNKLLSKMTHKEDGKKLGFIMLDVDYFKPYNDFYGHFKGDDALKSVARVLKDNQMDGMYVSRYGGDEFVCLCMDLEDRDIEEYIKRVGRDMENVAIPHEKSPGPKVLTVSMGYCNEIYRKGMDWEPVLNRADRELYSIKKKKRARIKN
ncbi:diguanylate cyclase (GGDEF) domain-containing protein [Lachnospiraceae bacterium NLAE-zl-G231]|nr:diguanylate cyclase (GGDEF) domain-containing protein [Lachnospiraceae bacterium NLAE-zl-G231]